MSNIHFLKNPRYLLVGIIFIGCIARFYGFTSPIADWHSWRQADTSAVSRNFIKQGYDILHPRFDDLSNIPSGKDNPNGYRFVEFPIYNIFQAGLYQLFGILSLEEWGRLVTIISSLFSILFIFLITRAYAGERAGLLAAFLYAFLPYSVYYGRVILPDTMMVTFSLGAVYFFMVWSQKKKPALSPVFFLSLFFSSVSLLLKPYAAFFLLPILYIAWVRFGRRIVIEWKLWLFAVLSVIPLILWRVWMTQFPEGIPSNIWLLNGNGIRFRPAFFRWIVYERLIKLILGFAGTLLFLPGIYAALTYRKLWFFISYAVGSLLYVVIFATGNVQHDYYQILILPSIVMIAGIGADWILRRSRGIIGGVLVVVVVGLTLYLGWQQVKGYYYINRPSIISAGKAVDRLTEKDAKVVALYGGDTSFLYQTNRQGWPALENGLDDLIRKGADYLVFADPSEEERHFGEEYKVIASTKEYVIFDLHTKK